MTIVHKVIAITVLIMAITVLAACGGGVNNAPSDPKDLILEDTYDAEITNVKALLESSDIPSVLFENPDDVDAPEDFKDEWRDEWEDKSRALATDPDIVTYDIDVSTTNGGYFITTGEFDFGAIKNELEDQGYDDGTYRDQEIWESENGNSSVALFEDDGSYVYGSTDVVKEVLKAIDRSEGFMTTNTDLRLAIDKIDGGALVVIARSGCSELFSSTTPPNGCRVAATAFTGGDEDSVELTSAVVFSSERRAEAGMDDIEDVIEDDDSIDADLEEIKVDGEIVTFKVTIYEYYE